MEPLILKGTEDTPSITLDITSKQFEISGRSLPEDVVTFYQPVLDWINLYSEKPEEEMIWKIRLEYFNTASSKIILDILMALEEIKDKGTNVIVQWHFDKNDNDMMEAGEEYKDLVGLTFELMGY
ncbi:MAG: DUF1987 domain-containing protein [Bacteroidetes bacterium]|nr:DUF1987 domain-containing protein [Bacteroidota bacterium]